MGHYSWKYGSPSDCAGDGNVKVKTESLEETHSFS